MAEVQLVVKQLSTQVPVTINLNVTLGKGGGAEEEAGASPEIAHSTGEACFSSLSTFARHDPANDLNQEDRENLQFTTDGGGGEGESYGKVLGVFMKKIADGLRNEVEKFVRDAVREGDPSYTISCLQKELDHTFEVNNGQGTFNSERVMAAFYLMYCLVKGYYQKHGNDQLLDFIKQLVPSLIYYLFRIGFISWLIFTGGWVVLRSLTRANSLVSTMFSAVFGYGSLTVGVIWLSWRAARYLWWR